MRFCDRALRLPQRRAPRVQVAAERLERRERALQEGVLRRHRLGRLQCALGRSLRLVVGAATGSCGEVLGERVELLAAADGRPRRCRGACSAMDFDGELTRARWRPLAFNNSVSGAAASTGRSTSAALASAATGGSRLWHNSGALAAALDAHWPASAASRSSSSARSTRCSAAATRSSCSRRASASRSASSCPPRRGRASRSCSRRSSRSPTTRIGDLEGRDVSVARWDSSVSREDKDALLRELSPDDDGDFDADAVPRLLYCTPEALVHAEERHPKLAAALRGLVGRGLVNAIVVDECHCVSQWGHDFRDAYAQIGEARRRLGLRGVPVQALTATATPRVRDDVSKSLKLTEPVVVTATVDRPNIFLEVVDGDAIGDAEAELADLYEWITDNDGAGLVYACKREEVERIAAELSDAGVDASAYHAGMEAGARARVAGKRERRRARVVVATIAFGMGISASDVRWVVHWDLPKTLANLLQEMGRGGRDGQPAASRVPPAAAASPSAEAPAAARARRSAWTRPSSGYCAAGARCRRALLLAPSVSSRPKGPPRARCCDRCDARLAEPAAAADAPPPPPSPPSAVARRRPPSRAVPRAASARCTRRRSTRRRRPRRAAASAAFVGGLASEDEARRKRKLAGRAAARRWRRRRRALPSQTAVCEAARRARRRAGRAGAHLLVELKVGRGAGARLGEHAPRSPARCWGSTSSTRGAAAHATVAGVQRRPSPGGAGDEVASAAALQRAVGAARAARPPRFELHGATLDLRLLRFVTRAGHRVRAPSSGRRTLPVAGVEPATLRHAHDRREVRAAIFGYLEYRPRAAWRRDARADDRTRAGELRVVLPRRRTQPASVFTAAAGAFTAHAQRGMKPCHRLRPSRRQPRRRRRPRIRRSCTRGRAALPRARRRSPRRRNSRRAGGTSGAHGGCSRRCAASSRCARATSSAS